MKKIVIFFGFLLLFLGLSSEIKAAGCDYIITRNMPDFEQSPVSVITPEQFVKRHVSKQIM